MSINNVMNIDSDQCTGVDHKSWCKKVMDEVQGKQESFMKLTRTQKRTTIFGLETRTYKIL